MRGKRAMATELVWRVWHAVHVPMVPSAADEPGRMLAPEFVVTFPTDPDPASTPRLLTLTCPPEANEPLTASVPPVLFEDTVVAAP